MKDFRKLQVWEKSHALVLKVYKNSRTFPKEERYGLTSQLRRSAISIPSNIAEGCGRKGDAELSRFLNIALGSASELEYQCFLAQDLGYWQNDLDYKQINRETVEIKRMLAALISRLNADRL